MPKSSKVVKPKPPLKSMEKQLDTSLSTMKKKKKKNYLSFSIYIYKLMKSVEAIRDVGISKKSILIMNNFVSDMLEKIALEAGRFVAHGRTRTMGSRDIQSAVKLLLSGALEQHANIEGMKAVKLYNQSIARKSNNSTSPS